MAITLGVLTTKDGRVIPLPSAAAELVLPEVERLRKAEEKKYKGCLRRRPIVAQVWDRETQNWMPVTQYGLYRVQTENLKRKGGIDMNDKMFDTKAYQLFETYFKNANTWMNSRRLGELTGVPISSISVLLRRAHDFLVANGLMKEKDEPGSAKGKLRMFVAVCENPVDEAKIWYAKMMGDKKSRKNQRDTTVAKPSVVIKPPASLAQVSIDTQTMEAVVRVPLAKLAEVLRLMA
jgi:hypothetical protein